MKEAGTPLHVTSAYGLMAPLPGCRATVDHLDGIEESPLSSAVFFQRLECMRLLIDHGADVNLAGYRGYTPLHVAGYLIENWQLTFGGDGAGLGAKDSEGLTLLELALVNPHK